MMALELQSPKGGGSAAIVDVLVCEDCEEYLVSFMATVK